MFASKKGIEVVERSLVNFIWFGYIDDILMVWTHGEEKLDQFMKYL